MIRMLSKRLSRVLRVFTFSVVKIFMTSEEIALRETQYAIEHGEYDEAIAILQRAIDSNPNSAVLYYLRGCVHFLQLKYHEAIEDFSRTTTLAPHDSDSYVMKGTVQIMLGEYEGAVKEFTTAIAVEPNAEAYSGRGEAYTEMGEYNAAVKDYERVIDLRPDARAYVGRGKAYFGLMHFDDAMNNFDKATDLDPSNTEAYLMRGHIHEERKNYEIAIEEYTQIITLTAEFVDTTEQKSLHPLSIDSKSYLYEIAVVAVGNAYLARAICRSRIGDTNSSLSDFSAAIKLMPENANYYLARAVTYIERDEYPEAIQDLEVALDLDSRSALPYFMRSMIHYKKEDFENALRGCHEALALSPTWADPYRLRGTVFMHLGDYEAALHDFGKSIEFESEDSPAVQRKRDYSILTLTLTSGYPAGYAFRGLAHLLLGDEAPGREDIRTAIELGYTQSDLEETIEKLVLDGNVRIAIEEVIRSIAEHMKDESRVHSSGKLKALSREGYVSLFRRLGFRDVRVGRTLKHRGPVPSVYFNCRYGVVSFVAYAKDGHRFCLDFWDRIPPKKRSDAKNNLITVVPRAGKEQDAFEHLLSDNTEGRSPEVARQSQESTMRIMVNDYRGRNPNDTVDGRPISAVIHVATCGHIPRNPSHWWITFDSLEAAQSEFGINAATCVVCLEGHGRHLDRVQRA